MKCKGAIFDMDGLLFDTERVYQQTWQEIAEEKGVKLGKDFPKAISGTNGAYMCHVIEEYYHVSDGSVVARDCMERVRAKLSVCVPVKKGVQEILDFFREKDVRMAVASSSMAEQIESNLKIAGHANIFPMWLVEQKSGMGNRHRIFFNMPHSVLAVSPLTALYLRTVKTG